MSLFVLKLGGSIITSKREGIPNIRREQILRIAKEIKKAQAQKKFDLILIHGVGSFGHVLAKRYQLWEGIKRKSQILPFSKTQAQGIMLNQELLDVFGSVGLPVFTINPSAIITQKNGKLFNFDIKAIGHFLSLHFIPILYGTVVPDIALGGSICSGDTMLCYLAQEFRAKRAIFASDVDGVFTRDQNLFPEARLINQITNENYKEIISGVSGSASKIDVGGGMRGKIEEIKSLAKGIEIWIVNGEKRNVIKDLLLNKDVLGTRILLR